MVMNHYLCWGLVLVPLFMLFIPWRLVVHYRFVEGDGDLSFKVVWLGLDLAGLAMPILRFGGRVFERGTRAWVRVPVAGSTKRDLLSEAINWRRVFSIVRALRFCLRALEDIEKLHWHMRIGLGDAASTALVVGALQGVGGFISAIVEGESHIDKERVAWSVVPGFDAKGLDMVVDCIVRVNVGYIMITSGFNLLRVGIRKGVDLVGQWL